MKKIGVIGGMGAVSTISFYSTIVKHFQIKYGAYRHYEFPYMMIINLPIPDHVSELHSKNIMKKMTIDSAILLEKSGADFIVMPCNTEHVFYDDITSYYISIDFINMIKETIDRVKKEEIKNVLLLSTGTTVQHRIFHKHADPENINITTIREKDQQNLNQIIWNLQGGKNNIQDRSKVNGMIQKYKDDVDGIIIGCTELSLIADPGLDDIKIFDSLKILSDATIKKYEEI